MDAEGYFRYGKFVEGTSEYRPAMLTGFKSVLDELHKMAPYYFWGRIRLRSREEFSCSLLFSDYSRTVVAGQKQGSSYVYRIREESKKKYMWDDPPAKDYKVKGKSDLTRE